MPDTPATPPEAGTTDYAADLAAYLFSRPDIDNLQWPAERHQVERVRKALRLSALRLSPSAPEPQDSGVRGYLPALGNVRKGEAIGDDGSPLSTTGLDTRRTTVPASPSAPSAREGERDRVLWLAKRLSWFDGLDEEEAIPDDFTLDMAWDHREPEARIICLKVAGAFVSEFERSLASRPVSGPGTVTEAMLKDAALLAGDVAGRLDEVQSVLDRSGSVITAQNVRRCIKDLNRLAASLAGVGTVPAVAEEQADGC